jgi:nucleoside-diphosphate-sugar epimerase
LPITGTGEETRDFTFVEDVLAGLLAAGCSEAACGDVFNLASARETRVIDLASAINKITGNTAGLVFKEKRDWDHTSRRWASIDKARRVLGYEPQTLLEEGLPKTLRWFSKNWSRIQLASSFCVDRAEEQPLSRAA